MRHRPSPFLSIGAVLLVGLLSAGCADDTEPAVVDAWCGADTPEDADPEELGEIARQVLAVCCA